MTTRPVPGQPAPDLSVDLVGGGSFKLADSDPEKLTMVVFYRGLHCPVCKDYNQTLDGMLDQLDELGIEAVAVSMDTEDRATESVEEWGIDDLRVGYGLDEATALEWGLYMSTAIKDGEPDRFSEPGLFLVEPDGTLFYAAINSMPFGRPDLERFAKSIGWVQDNDYPSRGRAA